MSDNFGILCKTTLSLQSTDAARIGSAEFLAPAISISPCILEGL